MKHPEEIAFLDDIFKPAKIKLENPKWLKSDFAAQHWRCEWKRKKSKDTIYEINWDITLHDGSKLIENDILLNSFKYLLANSTLSAFGDYNDRLAPSSQLRAFNTTLSFIDHIILHGEHYQISHYGLSELSTDDLKLLIDKIALKNDISESLFDWHDKLVEFLLLEIEKTSKEDINKVISAMPGISFIDEEQCAVDSFPLPKELVPKARAVLFLKGFYYFNQVKVYKWVPSTRKISNIIYNNTLRQKDICKSNILILNFNDVQPSFFRELPCSPVANVKYQQPMSENSLREFRRCIYNLGILHDISLPAPSFETLYEVNNHHTTCSKQGRFKTLPSNILFDSLKNAIELHLKYGKEIIDSFCKVAITCKKGDYAFINISDEQFNACLSDKISIELGVKQYSTSINEGATSLGKALYFERFRKHPSLLEMLYIYYGAVQLVVGSLMGRRISAMESLKAGELFDTSNTWLIFQNAKSTRLMEGKRLTIARPIDPLAVSMLKQLERLQKILNRLNIIDELKPVFWLPAMRKNSIIRGAYNSRLDMFCDYFETGTDSQGRRYYIRQHQLRRFFALMFFYGSSFGGLETIRWMLGHTDLKHLWHYITESLDGSVLRNAKAQYVAECLHLNRIESFESLADLLESKYRTRDFSIVETEELEYYINELLERGDASIEPQFFEDENGQQMRVLVKIEA